jgi:hypothetical protein
MERTYRARNGERFTLFLDLVEGEMDNVTSITAALKKAGPNGSIPSASTPVLETFTILESFDPPGWMMWLTEAQTAELVPGLYVMNAALSVPGFGVVKTDPLIIEIKGTVA